MDPHSASHPVRERQVTIMFRVLPLFLLVLVGCTENRTIQSPPPDQHRLSVEDEVDLTGYSTTLYLVKDRVSKREFLVVRAPYSNAVTIVPEEKE